MLQLYKYLLCLILLLPFSSRAQQDAQLLCYNAGFGGVTAGVGAIFNKPKGTDWKRAFIKGFWQGCIGGGLHYAGKKTLYLIDKQKSNAYALPAVLLHAAGSSIIENAAYNRPMFQTWLLYYGPARFDFSFAGQGKLKARLLPMAIRSIIQGSRYGTFDWQLSALSGSICFKTDDRMGAANKLDEVAGLSFDHGLAYTSIYGKQFTRQTIAHELVHQFQYNEYQVFNTWAAPAATSIKQPWIQKMFNSYIYFDAPYFYLPYGAEGLWPEDQYYKNFFEMEAQRFATNRDTR